jgi:hypothetical protein
MSSSGIKLLSAILVASNTWLTNADGHVWTGKLETKYWLEETSDRCSPVFGYTLVKTATKIMKLSEGSDKVCTCQTVQYSGSKSHSDTEKICPLCKASGKYEKIVESTGCNADCSNCTNAFSPEKGYARAFTLEPVSYSGMIGPCFKLKSDSTEWSSAITETRQATTTSGSLDEVFAELSNQCNAQTEASQASFDRLTALTMIAVLVTLFLN